MRDLIVTHRRALVVAVHVALWSVAFIFAFLLRFDFAIPATYWSGLPKWLLGLLAVKTFVHWRFGLFHGLWRYSGTRDLLNLLRAATISTLAFTFGVVLAGAKGFPRSILVIEWLASIMVVGGLRFSIRALREIAVQAAFPRNTEQRRRILIVGAGDGGEMLMREIIRTHAHRYEVVGFVDDSANKLGERIHGVPVLGRLTAVPEIVARERVDEVIIAIPSATAREMRDIVTVCSTARASIRTLPRMDHLIEGRVTINQVQSVAIEDLLGRRPIELDKEAIASFVQGRTVLVTGAGGSIGSELCRQIGGFGPKRIVLVEQAENSLFHIHRDLIARYPGLAIVPCIADICDSRRLEVVFDKERPDVIFHAAAHKHVPMMEENPGEALKNNVFGTRKVADLADRYGVEKFVMVSTDKAVNPTSVMGVSKRAAEIYIQALSQRSKTQFVTVRFGNVLGSEGSVIPIFKEQIARGGPITVTHPEMKRYFMTIPEACQLVMQAGAMGHGGEIFVLDMGDPVKIVDLATDLIRLSGLTPGEDIEIAFSGLRPGEKLFEELALDEENADKTLHPKIFVGRFQPRSWKEVERNFDELRALTDGEDVARIKRALHRLVPEYRVDRGDGVLVPPDQLGATGLDSRDALRVPTLDPAVTN